MAKCPNCNQLIPWLEAGRYTPFAGIICKFCGKRLYMQKKDEWFVFWVGLLIILLSTIAFRMHVSFKKDILIGLIIYCPIWIIFITFVWSRKKLEVRDKSSLVSKPPK